MSKLDKAKDAYDKAAKLDEEFGLFDRIKDWFKSGRKRRVERRRRRRERRARR